VVGIAVLLLVVALVVPRLFTSEQLKGYVIPPLEDATGRQVQIDAIGLRVLPTPAIRVSGFRLANAEGYGPAPAVRARALSVDVALWPLFVGTIRPTAVGLDAPIIRYEVAENGRTNFDNFGGSDTTASEPSEGPLLGGMPLSDVRVSEAKLHYTDQRTGQAVRLGFDAQVGVLPDGAVLTSSGTLDLRTVRAVLPSVGPDTLAVQDAQATYDVQVSPSAGEVTVRSLRFDTAPLALSATGTLTGLNDRPTVDFSIETDDADLAEMAAFIPAAAVEGLNPQGTITLRAMVSGPLTDTTGAQSLSVTGTGRLTGVGADYEGTALVRDLNANLALSLDSMALRSVQGQVLGTSLDGAVAVRDLSGRPRAVLDLKTGPMDLADLAALAPADQRGTYNPQGTLQLDAKAEGPLTMDAASLKQWTFDGQGQLAGFGADYGGMSLLRGLGARLQFSGTAVAAQGIDGQFLGRPLSGQLTVRDPLGSPQVEGQLAGAVEMGQAMALVEGDDAGEVQGTAEYDVGFTGPVDNPQAIRPSGRVRLTEMQVPYESFRAPLEIPEATVQLTGTGLSTERFTIRSGSQTMALQTTARNLFPVAEGLADSDPALSATFTLTADRLDLVALYPEADTSVASYSQLFATHLSGGQIKGQSPESLAEEAYGGVEVPAYAVEGRVEIGTLLNDPQRYDDLTMDVRMDDRRLALRNVTASTYDGTLSGQLTLDQREPPSSAATVEDGSVLLAAAQPGAAPTPRPSPAQSSLTYDFQLQDAQAGAVLRDWTTLGRFVTGTLTLNADGTASLTEGFLPESAAFTAIGQSLVSNGGLSLDIGPAQALADALKLPTSSLKQFKRLGGPFAIKDGQFQLNTWDFGGSEFTGNLEGALGFGGRVDLKMTMNLPLSTLQQSNLTSRLGDSDGKLGGLLDKLVGGASGDETVPVTVRLGGTMSEPTMEVLNRDAITTRIESIAKDAGLNLLRDFFGGGGGNR